MPWAADQTAARAELDSLRARLNMMVARDWDPRQVILAPRDQESRSAACSGAHTTQGRGTAQAIVSALELPVLARRRFRTNAGSVLADVGKRGQADDGPAARHPAAKVSALWRADLADDLAWRYEYESSAWRYATLRWLVVDPGGAAGAAEQPSATAAGASAGDDGPADVARLRTAIDRAAGTLKSRGVEQARQVLVEHLGSAADHLLRARHDAHVSRELLAATAEAALYTGCLTYARWPRAALAQAYLIQALALAHVSGDRQLGVVVLGAMTQQAVFGGYLVEAGNLVSTARDGVGDGATPELSAHLRLLTARDHALRDDLISCVGALKDAALTVFDRVAAHGAARVTRWVTEANPPLLALAVAAGYRTAGLPDLAHASQLIARQLADRAQSPCSALYVSDLERRLRQTGRPGCRRATR